MKHAKVKDNTNMMRELAPVLVAFALIFACMTAASAAYCAYAQEQGEKAAAARQAEIEVKRAEDLRIFYDTEEHEAQKRQWVSVKENLDILRSADEERRIAEEAAAEAAYWDWYWSQPVYLEQAPAGTVETGSDGTMTWQEFQFQGVVYDDDGHLYTYYSERVLPGGGLTELNSNGRHSENGFVKDGDGYIAVASADHEKGTVVDTPFGKGKVYDTGSLAPGQVDIYVSF